ncbi:MAG: PPK2 family polyphosphate kinase, partial [Propionicimonas sp.]|nr:PPK2 family polyphosphate kinase [Propionicimonas sp.]
MAATKKSPKSDATKRAREPLSSLLRVPSGPVRMDQFDPRATPGYPGKGKQDAQRHVDALAPELSDLQERLYADGRSNPDSVAKVLVVLQGMDTSGKGGVIRHAIGLVDPQGVQLKAFKAPTAEELQHHYLWRIEQALPGRGMIGIFDRSHYEDVLVVRVDSLVPESVWSQRYDELNEFEAKLAANGTTIVKCMLNVSFDEQKRRLAERLADPTKYWKYNPGDLDSRSKWPAYMEAYEVLLERCNTEVAPWYVIPADRKWYRNWAVAELLREKLAGLDISWPA